MVGMDYVKSIVLQGMRDPNQTVRQTVGTVIVNIMAREEDGAWPEGLEALMKAVDSADPNEQEVSAWIVRLITAQSVRCG